MACEGACSTPKLREQTFNVCAGVRPILKRNLLGGDCSEQTEKRSKTVRFGEEESFRISPRKILHEDPPSMISTCYDIASQRVSLFVQNILNTGAVYEMEREDKDVSIYSEACDDATACPEHLEVTQ